MDAVMNIEAQTKEVSCIVCGSNKIHYSFSLQKFRIEECMGCGLMRLNPQPTDQELLQIYGPNYFVLSDSKEGLEHSSKLKSLTADYYLDQLELYTGAPLSGSLLEVGCGHGDFLARAAARGLSVTGVEYSRHSVSIAENRLEGKGRVICGEIEQVCAPGVQFDFVVFFDVMGHVRDPQGFLRIVHQLLRDGGIAVAAVPSLDSLSARLMKSKWVEFKPEHLWYFSTLNLQRLFRSKSFNSTSVRPARKSLSFDYVAEHFDRYPVPPFTAMIALLRELLPLKLRRYLFRVTAGGILMFARRGRAELIKRLDVVMPAYNEAKTIKAAIDRVLAKRIKGIEIRLVIVESNSTDGTRAAVREYEGHERVQVIWQDHPRGKGNAVRSGLNHVKGNFVLIQDADDEYDIEDYDALLEPLMTGEAAFVLGARHGGGAWKMRQFNEQRLVGHLLNFGHWFFASLVNVVYGLRLKDPFTMYKVFRADCLKGLKFECDRFDFDYELLIKLVRKGHRPIEIPVNYRSRSFKEGKKVDAFRDPWTWLRAIFKFRFQKL